MSIEMKKNEKFEVRIDPRTFEGEWLQHKPVSHAEQEAIKTYKKQKRRGELPVFTCMNIDPAFVNNELVYEKGLIPAVGYSYPFWRRVIREYDPTRNSRIMSITDISTGICSLFKGSSKPVGVLKTAGKLSSEIPRTLAISESHWRERVG